MSDFLIVAATAGVVLGAVGCGAVVTWLVMRSRGKSDAVTSLCLLNQRLVNTLVVRQDEQLSRVLAEEDTNKAMLAAMEKESPAASILSPAFRAGPPGRGEIRVPNMP